VRPLALLLLLPTSLFASATIEYFYYNQVGFDSDLTNWGMDQGRAGDRDIRRVLLPQKGVKQGVSSSTSIPELILDSLKSDARATYQRVKILGDSGGATIHVQVDASDFHLEHSGMFPYGLEAIKNELVYSFSEDGHPYTVLRLTDRARAMISEPEKIEGRAFSRIDIAVPAFTLGGVTYSTTPAPVTLKVAVENRVGIPLPLTPTQKYGVWALLALLVSMLANLFLLRERALSPRRPSETGKKIPR